MLVAVAGLSSQKVGNALRSAGVNNPMSVNVRARQLNQEAFVEQLHRQVYGLAAEICAIQSQLMKQDALAKQQSIAARQFHF